MLGHRDEFFGIGPKGVQFFLQDLNDNGIIENTEQVSSLTSFD
jgi:hypothetical protein